MLQELNEKINIERTVSLSDSDIEALTLLYIPLVGIDSYGLYMVLNSFHQAIKVKDIIDVLGISMQNLTICFNKLEALGLLSEYHNESEVSFLVNRPYPPKDFLEDEVLSTFFEGTVGGTIVKMLKKRYLSKNFLGEDVTKRFYEVFETDASQQDFLLKKGDYIFMPDLKQIDIKPDSFDLDKFVNSDIRRIVDRRKITLRLKSILLKIAGLYNYTNEQMLNIFMKCYDGNNIDYTMLIAVASEEYQSTYQQSMPKIVEKETLNPHDYEELNKRKLYNPEVFNRVMRETGFNKDVIDTLENYVMNNLEGETPNYIYVNKIAKDWLRQGITTREQALSYMEAFSKKFETKNFSKKESKSTKTEKWVDDYYNEALKGGKKNE